MEFPPSSNPVSLSPFRFIPGTRMVLLTLLQSDGGRGEICHGATSEFQCLEFVAFESPYPAIRYLENMEN